MGQASRCVPRGLPYCRQRYGSRGDRRPARPACRASRGEQAMNNFETRARNALLGLALGDAIGWTAMYHRAHTLPAWTRRRRREIDAQREETNVLRIPMPFSLNQPSETFDLCPTDDTEW